MKNNIMFGLIVIILAIFIALSSLNYIPQIDSWRLIISALLLWLFIHSLTRKQFFGIFISIGLGTILYREELGIAHVSVWTIIIVSVLLAIGFSAIFNQHKVNYYKNSNCFYRNCSNQSAKQDDVKTDEFVNSDFFDNSDQSFESEVVTYSSSFSESTRFVKSNNLRKCIFRVDLGSLKVYLDQARLSDNGATLELYCRLGELRVYVPRDAYLINEISCNLGEVSMPYNYNYTEDRGNNRIVLKGEVLIGEIKIIVI